MRVAMKIQRSALQSAGIEKMMIQKKPKKRADTDTYCCG